MKILGIRWPYIVAFAAVLALGLLLSNWATIPPSSITVTRLWRTASRVLEFAAKHDRLPAQLSELPAREGYDNKFVDGWGHEILYKVGSDGTVSLTSYGKDGRPGGDGKNADLAIVFASRRPDGKWCDSTELSGKALRKVNGTTTSPK